MGFYQAVENRHWAKSNEWTIQDVEFGGRCLHRIVEVFQTYAEMFRQLKGVDQDDVINSEGDGDVTTHTVKAWHLNREAQQLKSLLRPAMLAFVNDFEKEVNRFLPMEEGAEEAVCQLLQARMDRVSAKWNELAPVHYRSEG